MPVSFSHPTIEIQIALQRAIDLVSFGLQAADIATPTELRLPGVPFHVNPAEDRALGIAEARAAYHSWTIANGLRDAVEAVGPALEWARKICFLWNLPGKASKLEDGKLEMLTILSADEWAKGMSSDAKRFDRMPFPEKLAHLERQYAVTMELAEHVLSLNAARNCLAHRGGIVGVADLKHPADTALRLRWRRIELSALDEAGNSRPLQLPAIVEAGESISMTVEEVEKAFSLGAPVVISAEEFVEICLTYLIFAKQIEERIQALQASRLST